MAADSISIGVISDTHGLLRPEAMAALRRSDLLIHAGDVGNQEILTALGDIAPTIAVRGNVDRGAWADALAATEVVEAGSHTLYVLHDLAELDLDPAAAGFAAVVFGHSHRPSAENRGGVLYLNPGSAGPRRFRLPVTVASIRIAGAELTHEVVTLEA